MATDRSVYTMNGYRVIKLRMKNYDIINYTYIVIDTLSKQAAVIDPAWEMAKIVSVVEGYEVRLSKILVTHSHHDHVNLVEPLVELYNSAVFMSRQEIDYYRYSCKNLNALRDGEKVDLGETKIGSVLTPGHSAGSTCFSLPDAIFTGDTIFTEGCGVCFLPGGSPYKMFDSIQKVKKLISTDTLVFPGHSYKFEPGKNTEFLMEYNIYFQIEDRELFADFRMRQGNAGKRMFI